MDIRCALLTPCTTTNYEPVGEHKDNGHPHPLIHCNIHVNHYGFGNCGGCSQPLEKSAYYCTSCKQWLHESCAHLPHQIQHPFHPHHPLTLSDSLDHLRGKKFRCNACRVSDYSSFSYRCDLCEFYLDLVCASPPLYPMIYISELHHHPLAYYVNYTSCECSKCSYSIHAGFHCLKCIFDVHDHCLPLLPPTVKTKWHRHLLTLTHGPIKGDPDEGDSDEGDRDDGERVGFYCDCCEGKRYLKDPTYYCAECRLISHVGCVMGEVMDYLQAKSTNVEELCNTKVIVIGEAKTIDSIYASAGNEDRVEQGDHQDIKDEDRLRTEIAAVSAQLRKLEAKLKEYNKKYESKSLRERGELPDWKMIISLIPRLGYTSLNQLSTESKDISQPYN